MEEILRFLANQMMITQKLEILDGKKLKAKIHKTWSKRQITILLKKVQMDSLWKMAAAEAAWNLFPISARVVCVKFLNLREGLIYRIVAAKYANAMVVTH